MAKLNPGPAFNYFSWNVFFNCVLMSCLANYDEFLLFCGWGNSVMTKFSFLYFVLLFTFFWSVFFSFFRLTFILSFPLFLFCFSHYFFLLFQKLLILLFILFCPFIIFFSHSLSLTIYFIPFCLLLLPAANFLILSCKDSWTKCVRRSKLEKIRKQRQDLIWRGIFLST